MGRLAVVLQDFARTLVTDFSVQTVLDTFVEHTREVFPFLSIGVTLTANDGMPRHVAASGDPVLQVERLQEELGEGPCHEVRRTGRSVLVPNLNARTPFPAYARGAVEHGVQAVFAFPIRFEHQLLGVLDLYRDRPGNLRPYAVSAATTLADVAAAYLVNADRRAALRESAYRAYESTLHDALTGLGNRTLLVQRLEHAGRRSERTDKSVAVIYLDLDGFKQVNDTRGHRAGDELLVAVARRLSAELRPGDTLARVGGDEFVVLCEDVDDVGQVESVAVRIRDSMAAPFDLSSGPVEITASIGIAAGQPDPAHPESPVDEADTAMYEAKRRGGNQHVIRPGWTPTTALVSRAHRSDIRQALARHELSLLYQPVVQSDTGTVADAEALLRWNPGDGDTVAPEVAVAVADETGTMAEVERWELEQAGKDRLRWHATGAPIGISMNLSIHQLLAPDLVHLVESLWVTACDPTLITLELPERSLAQQGERAQEVLRSLRDLGVHLALDDFGGGFVSIDSVKRFPIDVVKLDKMIVSSLDGSDRAAFLVDAIVGQAHALSMRVVAKGVETPVQYRQARELGCEQCQGFFISRPISARALEAFVRSRSRHLADDQSSSAS